MNEFKRRFGRPFNRTDQLEGLEKNFPIHTRVERRNMKWDKLIAGSAPLQKQKVEFEQLPEKLKFGHIVATLGRGALVKLDDGTSCFYPYDELKRVKSESPKRLNK